MHRIWYHITHLSDQRVTVKEFRVKPPVSLQIVVNLPERRARFQSSVFVAHEIIGNVIIWWCNFSGKFEKKLQFFVLANHSGEMKKSVALVLPLSHIYLHTNLRLSPCLAFLFRQCYGNQPACRENHTWSSSSIIQNTLESSMSILTKATSVKGNFTGFHFITERD